MFGVRSVCVSNVSRHCPGPRPPPAGAARRRRPPAPPALKLVGAHEVVRDERLVLQLGARLRRGVLGAEPLCDGRALVGETVRRADGVGHDLGGDRAHVVVGHLHCLARPRRAGRSAAAAPAVHRSLQRVGLRRRCRCRRRRCRCRRRRCHGLPTRPGCCRRASHSLHRLPRCHRLHPLRRHQPRRLRRRLLLRLTLGLLLRLQQPAAPGPRLCSHATLPHLAWRRSERRLERRQPTACDGSPQRRLRPLCSRRGGLGRGGGRRGGRG
eukprot:scaffold90061_cov66-Phaeocystis_antarctica.AAC.10